MKKYIKLSKKVRINIDELSNSVNSFDKSFGLKFKKLIYPKPKKIKKTYKKLAKRYTISLLAGINHIPLDHIFKVKNNSYKKVKKSFSFIDETEFDYSKAYKIDSYEFRIRFISSILIKLYKKQNKIITNLIRKYKHSKNEYFIVKIQDYIDHIIRFAYLAIDKTVSTNTMLAINTYLTYSKKKKNKKVNKYIRDNIRNILETISNPSPVIEDILLINIFKLSSYLATNSFYDKYLSIDSLKSHHINDDLYKYIRRLGKNIIKSKSISPMFKLFNETNFTIPNKYYNMCEDEYVFVGIVSLLYTKFLINNSMYSHVISKILNKPVLRKEESKKSKKKKSKKKKKG